MTEINLDATEVGTYATVEVALIPDESGVMPEDYDNYDADDIAAFRAGMWSFLGVVVRYTIHHEPRDGSIRTEIYESPGLWGVDCDGSPANMAYIATLVAEQYELLREAWPEVPEISSALLHDALDLAGEA